MLAFYIYLIGVVDTLSLTIKVIFRIILAVSGIALFFAVVTENEIIFYKKCIFWSILILVISSFIPSSKTLASMMIIPSIVNNKQIQNISKNSLTILENLTKQWVIEITKE